jgi:hypothetical protein
MAQRGRPSKFTEAVASEIVERLGGEKPSRLMLYLARPYLSGQERTKKDRVISAHKGKAKKTKPTLAKMSWDNF